MTEPVNLNGYESLSTILNKAYLQASSGKGKERHARGKPFDKQPIMEISRMVGPGYATGQAMKKLQEAKSMMDRGNYDAAMAEALGAINYAAAFYMLVEEAQFENNTELVAKQLEANLAQSMAQTHS